jgi:hypothetical protein
MPSPSELGAEEAGERDATAPEPDVPEQAVPAAAGPDQFQIAPVSADELLRAYAVFETHSFPAPEDKMMAASFQVKLQQAQKIERPAAD